jgi:hypothetical protein
VEIRLDIDVHDVLSVHLSDGDDRAVVSAAPAAAAIASLTRAFEAAIETGYGECFWPAFEGGHYWWIVTKRAEAVEMMAMWTRGGASLWEHVFRATDAADWIRSRLASEAERMGLGSGPQGAASSSG